LSVIYLDKWKERKGYGIYEFPWGTAVKDETTGKWTNLFIPMPDGRQPAEIVLYRDVELHDNGIEFLQEE